MDLPVDWLYEPGARGAVAEPRPRSPEQRGLSTGFAAIDAKPGHPLRPGEVYIIAGRPSMGKTTLALNICWRVADEGASCVYVHAGEAPEHAIERMVALLIRVRPAAIRSDALTARDRDALAQWLPRMQEWPIAFVHAGTMPALDRTLCELWQAVQERDAQLAIIDWVEALRGPDFFGLRRSAGPKTVMRALRWFAREAGVALLVVANLTRKVERRADRRPLITDLDGGPGVAEGCGEALLLYRPWYHGLYLPDRDKDGRNTPEVYVTRPDGRRLASTVLYMCPDSGRLSE